MVISRGEVWWATLPKAHGSTPAGRRPVLVIQSNDFNNSDIRSVVVTILTTNLKLARFAGNVYLAAGAFGLPRDSVVNTSQIFTLDKSTLESIICNLPDKMIQKVDQAIKMVLGLT